MFGLRVQVIVFWSVFGIALSACANGQDSVTPAQALISLNTHLKSIGTISFKSSFRDRIAEDSEQFTNRVDQDWLLDLSGERCRFRTHSVEGSGVCSEFLVSPSDFHELQVDQKTSTAVASTSYLKRPENYFKSKLPMGYVSFPFGFFRDGLSNVQFVELLVDPRIEHIAHDEFVLSSETIAYDIRITLDSSKRWMPSQIVYTCKQPVEPSRVVQKISYRVLSSVKIGDAFFPQRFECQISTAAAKLERPTHLRTINGKLVITESGEGSNVYESPTRTYVAEVVLSEITVPKHDELVFVNEANIPNGLRVSMQDALHLGFEWRDGKIVATTPEGANALRASRFVAGNSIRFWIITSVTMVLLLSGVFLAWRRRATFGSK